MNPKRWFALAAWFGLFLGGAAVEHLFAGPLRSASNPGEDVPTIELFQGMEAGQITVRFIPRNSYEARILIENKTAQPIHVRFPEAFAGVPVLAQLAPPGGGQGRPGGASQTVGGAFNNNFNGGNNFNALPGGGNGFMNIPPEKTRQVTVPCVCLEHGKPDPTPRIQYQIVPIDRVVQKPEVITLLKTFSTGRHSQNVIQAATWHLNNGLTWEQLTAKPRRISFGVEERYFLSEELQEAMKVAQWAQKAEAPGLKSASSVGKN